MINRQRLAELKAEIGEDDFAEVVAIFCDEVEETLAELPGLHRSALPARLHFLKGSALNIGLDEVGALCLAEERRLTEDPAALPDIAAIRAAFERARPLLLG